MDRNFTKHHLLDFIPDPVKNNLEQDVEPADKTDFEHHFPQSAEAGFEIEETVNPLRYEVFYSSEHSAEKHKDGNVCYLMQRNLRVEDNFALNLAKEKSKELSKPLDIIIFLDKEQNYIEEKKNFLMKNIDILKTNLEMNNLNYTFVFDTKENLIKTLKKLNPTLLVMDFNPIFKLESVTDFDIKEFNIIEVDSSNIVPAKYADDKQAYNAASLRRKIYSKIYDFLTEFPAKQFEKNEGYQRLDDFVQIKLEDYAKYKNDPVKDVVSKLSSFINQGFISSQRIALEVIKSNNTRENKEIFLEELIVRKELSDNFCYYSNLNGKGYKSFDSLPNWAKFTLNRHKNDMRAFIFSVEELENAKTTDALWNASQNQLLREGRIHGYMRMYWAKMIAQWSFNAQEAINKAVYLNDKYAFDAPSANGYTGILWSIGGLHDRAFQDRPVTGEIRTMTYNGAKSKFDVKKYIERYSDTES